MTIQAHEEHLHNWPNAAGFQVITEQRKPVELKVTGRFPQATAGVLLRTGPSSYIVGDFQFSHWFDGFSQVYRFQLVPQPDGNCRVLYNSRRQVDGLLELVKKTGQLNGLFTFAQKRDPCVGFFGKAKAVFTALTESKSAGPTPADESNIMVTIHPSVVKADGKLECRTDAAVLKTLDMETLEPVGVANQSELHPDLSGPLSCAHAQFDPVNGDCYNYNLALGRSPTYRIFRTNATTGKTDILASVSGVPAAYIHSLFLTEHFVILCVWASHYKNQGLNMLWESNVLDSIAPFESKAECHWLVVDKAGKGLVKRFTSPAMFCFHTINAYEERRSDGSFDVIADLVEYENLDIVHKLYYDNLISNSEGAKRLAEQGQGILANAGVARYRLSEINSAKLWDMAKDKPSVADRIFKLSSKSTAELPTMNPRYCSKPGRFVYGIGDQGKSSFADSLAKIDLHTSAVVRWSRDKHTPGEAIFIEDPERKNKEDGGFLLSCVLDGEKGTSYLLCLDAETMQEVGKAESDAAWGFGFHGSHISTRL